MLVPLEKPGTPEELVHFGVKGMKWGVHKKEETSSETSASKKISNRKEARAKKHETNAKKAQTEIDQIKEKPKAIFPIQYGRNAKVKDLQKYRDRETKAAKDIREGHLTDFQKRVAIGAGATAVVLAAYGTYKLVDSGTAHQILSRNEAFKKNELLSRKMSPERIFDEVVKPINPNYGELGTKNNCRRATFAYEMRRRGYDVKATLSTRGTGQSPTSIVSATDSNLGARGLSRLKGIIKTAEEGDTGPMHDILFENKGLGKTKIALPEVTTKAYDRWGRLIGEDEGTKAIFSNLSTHPEGARGELGVSWFNGGAHSMAWEIIGGKPVIFDTQSGTAYDAAKFSQELGGKIANAGMTRLDNVELNTSFLRRWVRNVR